MKNAFIAILARVALMGAIISFLMVVLHYKAEAQTKPQKAPTEKFYKDTVIKSVTYKMYIGSRGGKYIYVTSKTGNLYKRYFKK